MKQKEDRYSPNAVLAACIVSSALLVVMCGKTLWVPASRVENLYVRSVVLSAADAGSAFAAWTGCDVALPAVRTAFLDSTGLSTHVDWDTRYFNTRNRDALSPTIALSASADTRASANATVADSPSSSVASPEVALPSPVPETPPAGSRILIRGGPAIFVPALDLAPNADALAVSTPQDFSSIKPGDIPAAPHAGSSSAVYSARNVSLSGHSPLTSARAASFAHSSKNPLSVFMFGDSQVFSLGSGLSRLTGKGAPISVDFLPVHSTGFIRSDYFNWPAKLEDTFKDGSYEAAVMMLGMNDYQSFWNEKGQIMKKGTPEWEAAYKDRCRAIIDIVLTSVPRLYWIGMPVVRNDVYNESLAYIDSVQQSLADEYSPDILVRVSLRDTIPGTGKKYADSVELASGKKMRVMSDDGSHFTVEGGQLAMKPLFDRLSRDYLFSEVPVAHLPE